MNVAARAALALLLAVAAPALSADSAIRVGGEVQKPGSWSAERVEKELGDSVKTVQYTEKGERHTARAVPLLALIQACDPKKDPTRKNSTLSLAAVVRAKDNYAVIFSVGELMMNPKSRGVWVALNLDGKPLPERDAPARLLVPDDEEHARWVFGVQSVTLVDATKLAGNP